MSTKVWVLGDAVIDLLPDEQGRLLQCPGGAPANVAVGVARLGGKSGFIGRVGKDPFGRFLRTTLQNEQVCTEFMHEDLQHRTSTVVVDLGHEGERSFTFMVRPSADLFLETVDLPSFQAHEWLHCCSIALSAEPSRSTTLQAMQNIREAGGKVSFDPNIRPDLWENIETLHEYLERALLLANVVKLSEEELEFISDTANIELGMLKIAEKYQPELLLVTRGKQGVMAYYQGKISHYPAKPVISVDTTGAGDAFVAGLLAGLSSKGMPHNAQQLQPVLELAQVCGGLATTAKGAMTALPYCADLHKQF